MYYKYSIYYDNNGLIIVFYNDGPENTIYIWLIAK